MSGGFLLMGVHAGVQYATGGGGGSPASYTFIKYQFFNDDGALPGTTTTSTIPVDFANARFTESGSNTASTVWFVSTGGVSTGDLVLYHVGWDDSANTTSLTASTDPTGGNNISSLTGVVESQGAEVRSKIFWQIASTSWAATSVRFTPSASEQRTAVVAVIPAGGFNSSNPIGSWSSYNLNGATSPQVSSPSFTATSSEGVGRLVAFNTIDADPITGVPTGWQSTSALDLGAVTHGLSYRTSTVAASESIPSENWTIAGDSSVTYSYILRPYTTTVDTSSTSVTTQNSSAVLSADTHYGIHGRVENSVSSGVSTFKWQYYHVEGTATWTDITNSSDVVQAVTSAYYSHGDDVPEYLTGSGTYESNNNAGLTTTGSLVLGSAMSSSGAYESHLNFYLVSADVSASDNVSMRIALQSGTALDTYTHTPTLSISAAEVSTEQVVASPWDVDDPSFVSTSITVGSNSNRALWACVATSGTGSIDGVSSDVDGSFVLVSSSAQTSTDGGRTKTIVWYMLLNPTAGSHTVSTSLTGMNAGQLDLVEMSNVNQTTPYGTPVTANTGAVTSYSHTVTGAASGDMIVTGMINGVATGLGDTDIVSSGDDPQWEVNENSYWGTTCLGTTKQATGTSEQIDYTMANEGSAVSGFAAKKA